jgi:hypothetical protein
LPFLLQLFFILIIKKSFLERIEAPRGHIIYRALPCQTFISGPSAFAILFAAGTCLIQSGNPKKGISDSR